MNRMCWLELPLIANVILCAILPASLISGVEVEPVSVEPASIEQLNGLIVPEGFEIEQVANDRLVHDAIALTIDSKGQPIVSGPGYIRTLIDSNNDGRYDTFLDLGPAVPSGAQGLFHESSAYYYVAEGGLWKVDDVDGDSKADGKAIKLLALPTGGEHDSHAIRRGPDGWWYLIVGNFAKAIQSLKTDAYAAIQVPRAGTLWRISPDFKTRGVWAHGMRNAYDFDFLFDGTIVTYDSDEERELGLPWYRPTRVYALTAGSDAGWTDSAWSDLDLRPTMPQVLAKLGRGSPTGVKVYDHACFPSPFQQAIIVADWTFGRIIAVHPQPSDKSESNRSESNKSESKNRIRRFASTVLVRTDGEIGFAPTDIAIDHQGRLLITTGGRGTTGSLMRLSYKQQSAPNPPSPSTSLGISNLGLELPIVDLLKLSTPWESNSRSRWFPYWRSMPSEARVALLTKLFDATSPITTSSADTNSSTQIEATTSEQYEVIEGLLLRSLQYEVHTINVTDDHQQSALIANLIDRQLATKTLSPFARSAVWWALGRLDLAPRAVLHTAASRHVYPADDVPLSTGSRNSDRPIISQSTDQISAQSSWNELLTRDPSSSRWEAIGLRLLQGASNEAAAHKSMIDFSSSKNVQDISLSKSKNQEMLRRWAEARYFANTDLSSKKIKDGYTEESLLSIRISQAHHQSALPLDSIELRRGRIDEELAKGSRSPASKAIDGPLLDAIAIASKHSSHPSTAKAYLDKLVAIQSSLGDMRSEFPLQENPKSIDISDGFRAMYSSTLPPQVREGWANWCIAAIQNMDLVIPSDSVAQQQLKATVKFEAIRAISMLGPTSSSTLDFLLQQISDSTHPSSDIHMLIGVSCCTASRTPAQSMLTAEALAGVTKKISVLQIDTENRWPTRMEQLWTRCYAADSLLAKSFVNRPSFGKNSDLIWIGFLLPTMQYEANMRLLKILESSDVQQWEESIALYVSQRAQDLSADEVRQGIESLESKVRIHLATQFMNDPKNRLPLINSRQVESDPTDNQEQNSAPRAIEFDSFKRLAIHVLSQRPQPQDYRLYLEGITSSSTAIRSSAWTALEKLDVLASDEELKTFALIVKNSVKSEAAAEFLTGIEGQRMFTRAQRAIESKEVDLAAKTSFPKKNEVRKWIMLLSESTHSPFDLQAIEGLIARQERFASEDWRHRMEEVTRYTGNTVRGKEIYQLRRCDICHGSDSNQAASALGPSLSGVAKRFSRVDLYQAIFEPSATVSDRYRAMKILTESGSVITGIKIYDSVDGVLLQKADGQVVRVDADQISEKVQEFSSLMPNGLLDDLPAQGLADLENYLRSL